MTFPRELENVAADVRACLEKEIPCEELDAWRDAGWSWICFPDAEKRLQVECVVLFVDREKVILIQMSAPFRLLDLWRAPENLNLQRVVDTVAAYLREGNAQDVRWFWDTLPFERGAGQGAETPPSL
jgi:hypothetical protein